MVTFIDLVRLETIPYNKYILNYQLRKLQILCKAANDVSGDIPDDNSPSGMSLYERTIETLTTLFPLWVMLISSVFVNLDLVHLCSGALPFNS